MIETKPKRTANHSAYKYVDKREEFTGSSLRGEAYRKGFAPHMPGTWLSDFERVQYEHARDRVTYIVWSFYTPIAYYIEGRGKRAGWCKVGQTFSAHTARHYYGALRNVPGHRTTLTGKRGDWTVTCADCGTTRHFTRERDTHGPLSIH